MLCLARKNVFIHQADNLNKQFLTDMKSLLIGILLLNAIATFGQVNYYKMPNGKIIDAQTYKNVKEKLSLNGKVEEIILRSVRRQDSIIITPKITVLTQKDKNGNYIDPYGEAKKLIGLRFPIEQFKKEGGSHYPKSFLEGKPTLINIWFTTCVPCIAEIPLLNSIHNDLVNKVNFIALTFERKAGVDAFLKKTEFDFMQLTDAKTQLDNLKIFAFPTNLILDKNGIVVDVYGDISNSKMQVAGILNDLL